MHGGADALAAGMLTGSMHGARSYWRIMRAAARRRKAAQPCALPGAHAGLYCPDVWKKFCCAWVQCV